MLGFGYSACCCTDSTTCKVSNQLFLVLKPMGNVDLADTIPIADAIEVLCCLLLTPPYLLHLVKNLGFLLY